MRKMLGAVKILIKPMKKEEKEMLSSHDERHQCAKKLKPIAPCSLNLFLIALLRRKKKREKYKLGGVYVNIFFTVYLLIVCSKQSTDRLRALSSTQG